MSLRVAGVPAIKKRQTMTLRVKDGQVEALINGVLAGKTLIERKSGEPVSADAPAVRIGSKEGQLLCQGVRIRVATP